ncbi:MAG: tRNA adenosine(34) deaminase TadA [Halomonadaceae bacterium]|nr:MAG: tRNA adenosine(34) deaminase TadA [Halomonadaceae bacterium]
MDSAPGTDEYWMGRALALARQAAEQDEVPVGALIVRDGEVIGVGFNCPIGSHDPSAHAEIRALRDAAQKTGNYRLAGATLYVTIEPCTMCAGALVHGRISRLVYGATEPKAGAVVSQTRFLEQPFLNWRIDVTGGVLAGECEQLISDFFSRRRDAKRRGRMQVKADS